MCSCNIKFYLYSILLIIDKGVLIATYEISEIYRCLSPYYKDKCHCQCPVFKLFNRRNIESSSSIHVTFSTNQIALYRK